METSSFQRPVEYRELGDSHGANGHKQIGPRRSPEISIVFQGRHQTTVFRSGAFAEAARDAARLRRDHHAPESSQENAAMKASVADAAKMDASPTGAACDIRAPIYFCVVTRGRCRHVHSIIGCRFAAVTMSAADRRPAPASGSITDFEPQIARFTFFGTVDSSADAVGGAPPEGWSVRF
jgi:hypothetical protein